MTSWNSITTNLTTSGLVDGAGNSLTGITIQVGSSVDTASDITWTNLPTIASGQSLPGVFNSDIVSDNFYVTPRRKIGVRISGLEAETYGVYAIARGYTSGELSQSCDHDVGIDINTLTGSAVTLGPIVTSASWNVGTSYSYFTATITDPTDYLTFVSQANSGNSNQYNGMQGLQVISLSAVPEPSAFAVLAGLTTWGFAATRRRRPVGNI
ncbi:MAG: hypothetical protein SynsKO_33390 [Synoicihabitans sp.]